MITNKEIGMNGRFGNQLFQYASLCGIAKKNNYDYGVSYNIRSNNEKFHFCLPDCFDFLEAKDASNMQMDRYIRDNDWVYNPNFFNIPDKSDIWGYFQSEKYFLHCKDEIKNQFQFNNTIKKKADEYFINGSNIVSLHIRLGDYVQIQRYHPICSIDYYNSALDFFSNDMDICIFTDDHVMAKQIFEDKLKFKKIIYINSGDKFIDMCLMTRCSGHIIANSSFSWWGAWLANSNCVVAPSNWFGPDMPMAGKHHDIYCEEWKII